MSTPKDPMNPQDTRNLFIFCVISLVLYLAYNNFVVEPQRAALEKARQEQIASMPKVEAPAAAIEEEPLERSEALSNSPRIKIDNVNLFGTISLTGGRIDDIGLKKFHKTLEKAENVTILSPKGSKHPRYIEHGWVSSDTSLPLPSSDTVWQVQGNATLTPTTPATLIWSNGQGLTFTKTFTIDKQNLIGVEQTVSNDSGKEVTIYPYGLIAQRGLPAVLTGSWLLKEGIIGFVGDEFVEEGYKKIRKIGRSEMKVQKGWVGVTDKYWLTSIIPPQQKDTTFAYSYSGTPPAKKQKDKGLYQTDFTGAGVKLAPGQSTEFKSHIVTGAKKVLELEGYSKQLDAPRMDLAVNFGWFWFMSKPFFYALHYLGQFTGNFGLAIILFTILIRMAVFPLTNASFKSFAKMKKVGPQIGALKKKHGDDKQKMQQALMEMYKREGVNPMAGCVPMIIQIPIFFALYKVLFVTIEMRHAPFYGWITDLSAPDPTSVFNLFGLIPWDPPSILQIGVWPCLMLLTMVVQRKLNPPPTDPIQRDMANYFPFVMAFMMSQFAAGLVIYWTFSAFMSIMQQMLIMTRMGVPIYLFGQSPDEKEALAEVDANAEALEDIEGETVEEKPEAPKTISPPKPKKKTAGKKTVKKTTKKPVKKTSTAKPKAKSKTKSTSKTKK